MSDNGSGAPKKVFDRQSGRRIAEGRMDANKREGCWIHWYKSGECRALGVYRGGVEVGLWSYWYDNGTKAAEGIYIDGVEDGHWRYWHDNGALKAEGPYANGELEGRWVYYDRKNQPVRYEDWLDGDKIRRLKIVR
ncbi:MAG: hypothetical protein R3C68_14785 [Myxococcota bacterium]